MKTQLFKFLLAALFYLPAVGLAQTSIAEDQDLTGVWKGALFNDTTQQFLHFELAISKEKGKLLGYSYTQFENTDKKEWIVKKIKIKQKGEQLIIEDVEQVTHTFSEDPPRGVRWIGIVNFHADDTSLQMKGNWSTSRTKFFSPATGSIQVRRAINYKQLTIIKKLQELDLDETLSFVIAERNMNDVAINSGKQPNNSQVRHSDATKTISTDISNNVATSNSNTSKSVEQPGAGAENVVSTNSSKPTQGKSSPEANVQAVAEKKPSSNNPGKAAIITGTETATVSEKTDTKVNNANAKESQANSNKVIVSTGAAAQQVKDPVTKQSVPGTQSPVSKESAIAATGSSVENKRQPDEQTTNTSKGAVDNATRETAIVATTASLDKLPGQTIEKEVSDKADPLKSNTAVKPIAIDVSAAANVTKRKIANTQEVFYHSDSLILSLYDNGEVDGDTVSVLLNGNIIFAKQGLTTKANSKVIYIGPDTPDSLVLVMYAENLGSIPPNTGLLVVRDGEAVYDVRFRADLQSNAAIILRRKQR